MKIVADENMPLVKELFGQFAEVKLMAGRKITSEDLIDAEALLVRSVTQVNQGLLEASQVNFVGSATIGTDHIDRDYLVEQGIQFAYAPGCNAQAVAEYVLSAIAYWAEHQQKDLTQCRVGIIGAGNVGSKVAQVLELLGIDYLLNDPPLEEQGDSRQFVALKAIQQCDVVTCHVPLTKAGKHPTYHLINQKFLAGMAEGSLLINSSRGAVLDNQAALQSKRIGQNIDFILDVWENEPNVNHELLEQTLIATPHIAGYTQEGKTRGTYQLYQALCQWQGIEPAIELKALLPAATKLSLPQQLKSESNKLYQSLKPFYDIEQDDEQMRLAGATIAAEFDNLRKNYPQRLEFLELE
ncbi:MAG TPA: 4-phosphoerythronate dehydrogenase [Kangiella sp.]